MVLADGSKIGKLVVHVRQAGIGIDSNTYLISYIELLRLTQTMTVEAAT
jgi:hypothetical protein